MAPFLSASASEAVADESTGDTSTSWIYPHPTDFRIVERPIDDVRKLKVAVIGGGLAGITAGVLLPAKVPGIELTIIDKNSDFGGTWFENKYPGVRCDIPSHVYQATFAPKIDWSEEYAQGAEIRDYWQSLARKHDLYAKSRLQTRVTKAVWEPQAAKWKLELQSLADGGKAEDSFDFIITAIGKFNDWKLPDYPGINEYRGLLRHSSDWDADFDARGKRIATIGNGASGIQVTTELSKIAEHVDHYARSRTWIAGSFNSRVKDRQDVPMLIAKEQQDSFQDEGTYLEYRKGLEDNFFRSFDSYLQGSSASQDSEKKFVEMMRRRLADKPELLDKLVPDFPPNCRRLTPGPGYLEALTRPHVDLIQTPIQRFTEDGIVTIDGKHRQVDAIICSTGANISQAPPFPIIAGDLDLSRDWLPDGAFGWPYTYLGVSTPGFPNLAFLMGPNPAGVSGTVPYAAETQVAYVAKMLRKISSQGIRTMVPSKAATDDFVAYADAYFPRMTLSSNCSSWSNGGRPGARIHGHWPGSAPHLSHVRRDPRWEDFEYTYEDPSNRFAYLGNGRTKKEDDPNSDMTSYLRSTETNDLRDLHERWWDL